MSDSIHYIDEAAIQNKRVLLRVDFNVSLNEDFTIGDDQRIKQTIPTIEYLMKNNNKLIILSHLGRPKGRDPKYSLKVVVQKLKELLPYNIVFVDDFLQVQPTFFEQQKDGEIIVLENMRFYPQEKASDPEFAKKLASLGDVFVNDAFADSHRTDASIVGIAPLLPSYGGLLLKKEITMISKAIENPQKPYVALLGGAKISTKLKLMGKLLELADYLLVGGAMANIFFWAQGKEIGKSFVEKDQLEEALKLLEQAKQKNTKVFLPTDVIVTPEKDSPTGGHVKQINEITASDTIVDIGPKTQAEYGSIIGKAKTIVWNAPFGYIENPLFRIGTDFIYYSITQNDHCISIVGGGDTLAAISKEEYLNKITHISTGGGAMLEFIEKGTLPGIDVLRHPEAR